MVWKKKLLLQYRHHCNNWLIKTRGERKISKHRQKNLRVKIRINTWMLSLSLCPNNKHHLLTEKNLLNNLKMCTISAICLHTTFSRQLQLSMILNLQEKIAWAIMAQKVPLGIKNKFSLNTKDLSHTSSNKVEFNWLKNYHYFL